MHGRSAYWLSLKTNRILLYSIMKLKKKEITFQQVVNNHTSYDFKEDQPFFSISNSRLLFYFVLLWETKAFQTYSGVCIFTL